MNSITNDSFGPLVAYLIPGATVLIGLRPYFPILHRWFASVAPDAPTLGGFLYLTVASLAVGMTVNALRWAILDTIHAKTGLKMPKLNFSRLAGREQAYSLLIEIHYKHYQHHGSMLIAVAVAYVAYRISGGIQSHAMFWDFSFLVVETVFFLMSRDTLRKYYGRVDQLLAVSDDSTDSR